MQIYFVRHGETDWNLQGRMQGQSDTPLNAHGLAQAERVAARLKGMGVPFQALYASPLQRAFVTAEAIGQAVDLAPVPEPRLIEHGVGPMEGLTMAEIRAQYPDVFAAWTRGMARPRFPGEETLEQVRARLSGFVEEVKARHAGQVIVAVSHGGALNALFSLLAGVDLERRSPFWFENASLSMIDFTEPWARLRLLNDTCHLQGTGLQLADESAQYSPTRAAAQEFKASIQPEDGRAATEEA